MARRIVVVGAGIAGAATAWHLARDHGAEVVLVERERHPGTRSSARNAAILRPAIPDPALHALAAESARFYAHPPPGFAAHALLRACGVALCADDAAFSGAAAWLGDPARAGAARELAPERLRAWWSGLADGVARCWLDEGGGVLDVHALVHGFVAGARRAGAELRAGCGAVDLLRDGGGAVTGVRVVGARAPLPEAIEADAVVLAGGGWAAEPAAAAGLPLPLQPRRRHLLATAPLPAVRPDAPVLWFLGEEECYFRPESGGLLVSACDAEDVQPAFGERSDPAVLERIAARMQRWLPSFADAGVARLWAAMRTFAPDSRFVLGPDPRAPGLHWAAALGGHGIGCGYAAGRLAAAWAADAAPAAAEARPFLPARLFSAAAERTPPAAASRPG